MLWSNIPNDRILKWKEEIGAASVSRECSWQAIGTTSDRVPRQPIAPST